MMRIKLSDLWRWDGTLERGHYLLLGIILFAAKFNLDRLISWAVFDRKWSIFDYRLIGTSLWTAPSSPEDTAYFSALVAVSLPFLWSGVVLTLRRLRSAGLPLWLVSLFFAPVIKLIFFAVLCVLPGRGERLEQPAARGNLRRFLEVIIPTGALGSAAMGLFASLLLALLVAWLGTKVMGQYGWSLFVGLPFCMGLFSVLVYGCHERRPLGLCLLVSVLSVGLAGVGLLLIAFEGIICLIMAAPLAGAMALAGGAVAYAIQNASWWRGESTRLFCTVILVLPAAMGLESAQAPEPPLLKVETVLEVNASPEKVWRNVVSFSELPPPKELLFRLGIAYPIRAEITGHGAGAVRHCNFSTGPFVEPIEVWDEPRLLKFSVTANPAPMQEWTPYQRVQPPHLDGFMISRNGQFHLVRLPDGHTRLEGTTWYQHSMWPVWYWQRWSDFIIHRIHLRVLNHVKQLSENESL